MQTHAHTYCFRFPPGAAVAGAQRPTTFGHVSVHCGQVNCLSACLPVPFPTRALGNGRGTSTSVLPSCTLTSVPSLDPGFWILASSLCVSRPDYFQVGLPVLTSKLRPHTGRCLVQRLDKCAFPAAMTHR